MQTRIGWLMLLTVGMAAAPTVVWGQQPTDNLPPLLVPWQRVAPGSAGDSSGGSFLPPTAVRGQQLDYEVPQADPVFPIPTYSPKPELGGFFFDSEFRYMQQTNPIRNQVLAVRGFVNSDGVSPIPQPVGTFNGNAFTALNANMVDGPLTFIPGYSFGLGYRFRDGLQVEVNYWHLFNVRYVSGASLLPVANQVDPNLANTFLFSPVYNFSPDWAGPNVATTAPGANPLGNFGIWNGASEMDLQFDQRLEKYEIMFRYPIWESEYDPISNQDHYAIRTYGQVGVRHYWEWEKFWWRVVHADSQGNAGPTDVAEYPVARAVRPEHRLRLRILRGARLLRQPGYLRQPVHGFRPQLYQMGSWR
jgi:hypothetical protein